MWPSRVGQDSPAHTQVFGQILLALVDEVLDFILLAQELLAASRLDCKLHESWPVRLCPGPGRQAVSHMGAVLWHFVVKIRLRLDVRRANQGVALPRQEEQEGT